MACRTKKVIRICTYNPNLNYYSKQMPQLEGRINLSNKIANNTPIIQAHARSVGIEDTSNSHLQTQESSFDHHVQGIFHMAYDLLAPFHKHY